MQQFLGTWNQKTCLSSGVFKVSVMMGFLWAELHGTGECTFPPATKGRVSTVSRAAFGIYKERTGC